MRMTALVFVCSSLVIGCSWGEGSGTDDPTPDAPGGGGGVCGDGVCAANEVTSCAVDCGSGGGSGSGSGSGTAVCGNNTCETGESPSSCPNDCTSGGGSGSGSGSTACPTPPPDISACAGCIIPGTGTCPGGDIAGCIACASGGGGGLPGGNCNNDGVCDVGEDASCVLDMCP